MDQAKRFTAVCQDPGDGSGDVIVDLPPGVLAKMGIGVGDQLSFELVDGVIVMKPVRDTPSTP